MKTHTLLLIVLLLTSCMDSKLSKSNDKLENSQNSSSTETTLCDYLKDYEHKGNRILDTIKVGNRLIDPIDDFTNFIVTDFAFVKRDNKLYKKSKTHRRCNGKFIDVEYYQEFSNQIELDSYKAYNDMYFTTKGKVNFWWVNSDGYHIIPINDADPNTFIPFEDICGGKDKNGIYYGCPNRGVYQLDIPVNSEYEFVPKKDNYWNSPNHYVIIDSKVYDIKYDLEKGYFCELDKTISANEILELKNNKDS